MALRTCCTLGPEEAAGGLEETALETLPEEADDALEELAGREEAGLLEADDCGREEAALLASEEAALEALETSEDTADDSKAEDTMLLSSSLEREDTPPKDDAPPTPEEGDSLSAHPASTPAATAAARPNRIPFFIFINVPLFYSQNSRTLPGSFFR